MRLAIWGISKNNVSKSDQIQLDEKDVSLYIDSSMKWEAPKNKYNGKQVINPIEIKAHQHEFDYILVGSQRFQNEMFGIAKEGGFDKILLPFELFNSCTELQFNASVTQWLESSGISVVKNWYVDSGCKSIIISISKQAGKKALFRFFPKGCFGSKDRESIYEIINLQNMNIEKTGNVDISAEVSVDICSDTAVYKIVMNTLNSCIITCNFQMEENEIECSEAALQAITRERSYNYDFVWHEYDYEFINHMSWEEPYTIIDVGANLGQSTENFLEHTNADVVAIEANVEYRGVLNSLKRKYGKRVTYLCVGAGNEESTLEFFVPRFEKDIAQESSFDINRAISRVERVLGVSITQENLNDYIVKEAVQVKPVDELLKDVNKTVRFVKIDVENYEYHVLEGMKKVVENYEPIILLEFNSIEQQEEIIGLINQIAPYKKMYWDYISKRFVDRNVCGSINYFLVPQAEV